MRYILEVNIQRISGWQDRCGSFTEALWFANPTEVNQLYLKDKIVSWEGHKGGKKSRDNGTTKEHVEV